jgi:hypothetical protein
MQAEETFSPEQKKIKTTIQELTTEKEAPLAPTTVRSGIDDDDYSSDEDNTTYEDSPSHTSSSESAASSSVSPVLPFWCIKPVTGFDF